MSDKAFIIKTATRADVDLMVEWAAEEGWNPGPSDAACYSSVDPEGFLIGFLGEEPVASISVVKYGDVFGFLGFYIVKPEYRGRGYGLQIWNAGMQYLSGRNVGLDGVVAQQENYKKSGFKFAYPNIRYGYEGAGGGEPKHKEGIVKLTSLSDDVIDAYQDAFFPVSRSHFFKTWIHQPESSALGILREGKLVALGVIRKCRSGYKIGPLHADDQELAAILFEALASSVASPATVYLDVPEINPDAMALVKKFHMNREFETARMYTGGQPEMPLERVYGGTSFEIG